MARGATPEISQNCRRLAAKGDDPALLCEGTWDFSVVTTKSGVDLDGCGDVCLWLWRVTASPGHGQKYLLPHHLVPAAWST